VTKKNLSSFHRCPNGLYSADICRYTSFLCSGQSETVKVDDIAYTVDTTTFPGTKYVTITLTISSTSDTMTAFQITNHALNYIYYSFNGEWSNESIAWVEAGDHYFYVNTECMDCP
jgi:hypothetical protein